jgi:ribose transport system ATP-binding protein
MRVDDRSSYPGTRRLRAAGVPIVREERVPDHAPRPERRAPTLKAESLRKRFGTVQALGRVSLELFPGEVHALVGENGAGKSTFAKIVGGAQRPDAGKLIVGGTEAPLGSPAAALAVGISVVYQDLNLAPELTVASNMFLAREPRGRLGFVDDRAMKRRAARLLEMLGASFPPDARISDLNPQDRQLSEIARALSHEPSILVMDEPTASLAPQSAERLFEVIGGLRGRGVSVLYITHELAHVFEIADRVTVFKDGELMTTKRVDETDRDEVIETMVGRSVGELFPDRSESPPRTGKPALEVRGLGLAGFFEDISFELHPGEIVGFAGLIGSGRTRLAQAIFGVLPESRTGPLRGEIAMAGERVRIGSPRAAIRRGIGYVPDDRKAAGLVLGLSVASNISLPQLEKVGRAGLLRRDTEARIAEREIESLRIRTPSPATEVANLSGGNQQKVVLGKWLALGSKILILDEPTPGVDIGAKAEIYALIRRIAEGGAAVMLISSDLPELIGLSDRVLVMSRGRIVAEEDHVTATEERIVKAAFTGVMEG